MPELMLHVPIGDECDFLSPWGPIGGPPRWRGGELSGMDSTFIITPDVLAKCFQPGGSEHDGIVAIADRSGYLTVVTAAGTWIYELFPARFDDDQGPSVYLAVWPD